VMTTEPTWADEKSSLWRLPRLQFFGADSPGQIKLKTAVAAAGLILNNPDGTGRTYRAMNRVAGRSAGRNTILNEIEPRTREVSSRN
jgi:hypothetical protein